MSITHTILGLLSWRPMTGYDLKKIFAAAPVLYWSGNNNQIYTTLVDLHKQGYVSRETRQQEDAPAQKIYSITPSGRQELEQWLLSEPELPQLRNPFLLQLAWAGQLDPARLDSLLEKYEIEIQVQIAMLQAGEEPEAAPAHRLPRAAYLSPGLARTQREAQLWNAIEEYWLAFYQNELNWVHNLRQSLETG
jgi:PadR family transcriptional regulator, regulatory protein AphA